MLELLVFKTGSQIKWGGSDLGFSRNCRVEVVSSFEILRNQKLRSPVGVGKTQEEVHIYADLINFLSYKAILDKSPNYSGRLLISGVLLPELTEVTVDIYNAISISGNISLDISRGATPTITWLGLYDKTRDGVWSIT